MTSTWTLELSIKHKKKNGRLISTTVQVKAIDSNINSCTSLFILPRCESWPGLVFYLVFSLAYRPLLRPTQEKLVCNKEKGESRGVSLLGCRLMVAGFGRAPYMQAIRPCTLQFVCTAGMWMVQRTDEFFYIKYCRLQYTNCNVYSAGILAKSGCYTLPPLSGIRGCFVSILNSDTLRRASRESLYTLTVSWASALPFNFE